MTTKTISGLYDVYDDAIQTVHEIEAAGVPAGNISMVANNADNRYAPIRKTNAAPDAEAGAAVGTIVGGGAGLLAGLGMLAIPGVGPVVAAGWLIATAVGAVVGAGAGAATGGLVGSLTEAGVGKDYAQVYAEGVRRGGTLVTARSRGQSRHGGRSDPPASSSGRRGCARQALPRPRLDQIRRHRAAIHAV